MLLAVALLLSTLIPRLDGRFLEISKQPPGTVAIVPNDDDGESLLLGPLFEDLQELDREKASEMISVKLLNQYHAKTFDDADQLNGSDMMLGEDRPLPTGLSYEADNRLEAPGNGFVEPFAHPPSIDTDVIDMKENGIEQDFVPTEPILGKRLLDGWLQSENGVMPPSENDFPVSRSPIRQGAARAKKVDSMAAAGATTTATTTTMMTTTSTTTRTTTVRKMMRKIRQQSVTGSSTTHRPSSTERTHTSRSAIPVATTTTSHRPPVPKIDITKLNLDHLENDLLSFSTLVPPQALASASSSARLLPRSIKPEEMVPSCGCQHRKRSLAKDLYSSEEAVDPAEEYDEYDDYDYNEVQKRPASRSLAERPMLFPAMSRLLAAGSSEVPESSIERAEKVHGTLERLMGIVTIFSHVDEFIQRKTKQSIRRLARLYESEESD